MAKAISLKAVISITLIVSLCEFALVYTSAIAQDYPHCFMIDSSGMLIDLDLVCGLNKNRTNENPLVFTNLQFQPSSFGNFVEVKGTVINRSNQVIPLKLISIQLLANNRAIAYSHVLVETGNGLNPGESLAFDKVISKKELGKFADNKVKIQVTQYR